MLSETVPLSLLNDYFETPPFSIQCLSPLSISITSLKSKPTLIPIHSVSWLDHFSWQSLGLTTSNYFFISSSCHPSTATLKYYWVNAILLIVLYFYLLLSPLIFFSTTHLELIFFSETQLQSSASHI